MSFLFGVAIGFWIGALACWYMVRKYKLRVW